MQFFAIVVAVGLIDFSTNQIGTTGNRGLAARTFHNNRVVGINVDFLGGTEIGNFDVLDFNAQIFEDRFSAGQHGNVFQHRFATVAVTGSFDGCNIENPAHLVDDESGESFAFNVFGNDQQRLTTFRNLLEQRNQRLGVGDLLFEDQDFTVFEVDGLLLFVSHEVRRQIASLKLHPFDEIDVSLRSTTFFDRDHAILTDFDQSVSQNLADLLVVVTGNGGDRFDRFLIVGFDGFGELFQLLDHFADSLLSTASHCHRIGSGGNVFQTGTIDGFSQHGGGGGAVTRDIIGSRGDFFNELDSHVFVGVFQFDVFRDGHTVFGHLGSSPAFIEHCISASGTESAGNSLGEFGGSIQETRTGVVFKGQQFSHVVSSALVSGPVMSIWRLLRRRRTGQFSTNVSPAVLTVYGKTPS